MVVHTTYAGETSQAQRNQHRVGNSLGLASTGRNTTLFPQGQPAHFRPFGISGHSKRNQAPTRKYTTNVPGLTAVSWEHLAAKLSSDQLMINSHVVRLDLEGCGLTGGDKGIGRFCDALAVNSSCKEIILAGNNLGLNTTKLESEDSFASRVAVALAVNTGLEVFKMDENFIQDQGAVALADALLRNKTLLVLGLRGNAIRIAGADRLSKVLRVHPMLRELDISHNMLGAEGCSRLAKGIAVSDSLLTLDISDCNIGDGGSNALGQALKNSVSLSDIDLSYNEITDLGAFTDGITTSCTLKRLDLHRNPIGSSREGCQALGKAIQLNKSLKQLDLSHLGLNPTTGAAIVAGLARCSLLRSACLASNDLGPSVGNAIAAFLHKSKLTELSLEDCSLGVTATSAIQDAAPASLEVNVQCNYHELDEADHFTADGAQKDAQ